MSQYLGQIVKSPIDPLVWVVALSGGDTMSGAMGATTSIRRAKRHAEETLGAWGFRVRWEREGDDWVAYDRRGGE